MNKQKAFLAGSVVAAIVVVSVITYSDIVRWDVLLPSRLDDSRWQDIIMKPGAVVQVKYALSLSYFDQISHAVGRLQSHQCWAAKMASKIVEPFVVDTSYLGGLTSNMNASNATRLRDLFDLDEWNQRSIDNRLPPLIKWEEFLQTAPRPVMLVRNNWRQLFRGVKFRCLERDLAKLRTFWTQFLKPHGFKIFRELCVDLAKHSELTKTIVNQNTDIDVTLIIDDWRQMLGVRGASRSYMVTNSSCDKNFQGITKINWMKPSPKVINDAALYISKYLNADRKYIAVMIRWEIALWSKHMNGSQCTEKILENIKIMQQKKNLSTVFMATDAGNLGSDTIGRTTRYSMVNPKLRIESLERTKQLLDVVYNPPISLAEYEKQFMDVVQVKNPAYVSIVQKVIAARAECLLRIPAEGDFQVHALTLYKKFHTGILCKKDIREC